MSSRALRQDLHTLAGAYALNALPAEEVGRFEEHMAHCESCRHEVRGFAETTALMGAAAEAVPPKDMRRRVLEEIQRTRQLAPGPAQVVVRPGRRSTVLSLGLAACLVLALALGGLAFVLNQRLDQAHEQQQTMAAVLAAPDAEQESTTLEDGASATVVFSEERGQLVFTAHGLSPMADNDYQLWVIDESGKPRSGGLIEAERSGGSMPLLASGVKDAEVVAVTVEPAGGSEQPTTEPMMDMPLKG